MKLNVTVKMSLMALMFQCSASRPINSSRQVTTSTTESNALLYVPAGGNCATFGQNPFDNFTPRAGVGGGPCTCTNGGYVYAWSEKSDPSTVKIGCTIGKYHETNMCEDRMHREMASGVRVEYNYICFNAINCKDWRAHKTCNAGEVYMQDKFYCQGRWLGEHGESTWDSNGNSSAAAVSACTQTNTCKHSYSSAFERLPSRPDGSNRDGKSEWFHTALADVEQAARDHCGFEGRIEDGFKQGRN